MGKKPEPEITHRVHKKWTRNGATFKTWTATSNSEANKIKKREEKKTKSSDTFYYVVEPV
jgi:hypothetical protein